MKPWKLIEVIVLATLALCVWLPAILFFYWSVRAGHFVPFESSFTAFMGAASGITLGILGLSWFAKSAN